MEFCRTRLHTFDPSSEIHNRSRVPNDFLLLRSIPSTDFVISLARGCHLYRRKARKLHHHRRMLPFLHHCTMCITLWCRNCCGTCRWENAFLSPLLRDWHVGQRSDFASTVDCEHIDFLTRMAAVALGASRVPDTITPFYPTLRIPNSEKPTTSHHARTNRTCDTAT